WRRRGRRRRLVQPSGRPATGRSLSWFEREPYAAPSGKQGRVAGSQQEGSMSDDGFNMSMRKFLKRVGVTSQQELERVVREERLAGRGALKVRMRLTAEGTDLDHVVDGEIDLD